MGNSGLFYHWQNSMSHNPYRKIFKNLTIGSCSYFNKACDDTYYLGVDVPIPVNYEDEYFYVTEAVGTFGTMPEEELLPLLKECYRLTEPRSGTFFISLDNSMDRDRVIELAREAKFRQVDVVENYIQNGRLYKCLK